MQLWILLVKDLKALFKQKAVIFTLLIPTFLIIGLGALPMLIGVDQPFEVAYLNEDQGMEFNLGDTVIEELQNTFENRSDVILVELKSMEEFNDVANAVWFPKNFTQVANTTGDAQYYIKYSDSDLRANTIMNSVVANEIETVIRETILDQELPAVEGTRVYSSDQMINNGERENRAAIAFPLAYMAFLILILSSSSMRITGFSAEKEAGMMELLLSAVIDRKELVMSKLLTGVVYGLASVASYALGLLILFIVQQTQGTAPSSEVSFLVINPELLNITNLLIIFVMFADLAFIGIEILLAAQLALGREAGDRLGSMAMMILSFLFYFSAIGDPLSQSGLQVLNPFFWPFRLALNAIFQINPFQSMIYVGLNILFSVYLLRVMTKSIEKEDVLFE